MRGQTADMGVPGTGDDLPSAPARPAAHSATHIVREIVALGRELDRALGDHLTVNGTDLRAMSLLFRGPLTHGELAGRLGLGLPATSMVVDRLESLGHVTRERDARDRRRVVVRATSGSTTRTHDALDPMIRETDALLDGLDAATRDVVAVYLRGVADAMRRGVEHLRAQQEG